MAVIQRHVPQGLSQRDAADDPYVVQASMSRATIRVAGHHRWRIATPGLVFAHLCLGIAAPYLLLTGFTVLGTLFAMLLIIMLSADTLVANYRQGWIAIQHGKHSWARSHWHFPLRAITTFSCIGIVSGILFGVALQGQPVLAAKASTSMDGQLALLSDNVNGLAFSPDGTALALETPTGIAIMNRVTGAIMRQLPIPTPGFVAGQGHIAIAWNTQLLAATYRVAAGEADYAVTAWHVNSGAVQFTAALAGAVSGLVWSPDSATLAGYLPPHTADDFGVIMQWDGATGVSKTPIFITNAPTATPSDALFAWSPDPTRMAVVNNSHTVLIIDLRFTNSIERFADTQAITALAWSPDGKLLASGHSDGSVSLLDMRTLTVTRTIVTQPRAVRHIAWSPNSGRLLVANGVNLAVVDVATARPPLTLNRPASQRLQAHPVVAKQGLQPYALAGIQQDASPIIATMVWSADGTVISARYSDGALVSWNATASGG